MHALQLSADVHRRAAKLDLQLRPGAVSKRIVASASARNSRRSSATARSAVQADFDAQFAGQILAHTSALPRYVAAARPTTRCRAPVRWRG